VAICCSLRRSSRAAARLELYIPFEEPTFLEKSVDFADRDWRARFFAVKTRRVLYSAPRALEPTPEGDDPYERNNRWMLDAAACGTARAAMGRAARGIRWRKCKKREAGRIGSTLRSFGADPPAAHETVRL
jgi:hypothetical protein